MDQLGIKFYCPHCGSQQLKLKRRGFSIRKALLGSMVAGSNGLLAGFFGSNNLKAICSECGREWEMEELRTTPLSKQDKLEIKQNEEDTRCGCWVVVVVTLIILIIRSCLRHQ